MSFAAPTSASWEGNIHERLYNVHRARSVTPDRARFSLYMDFNMKTGMEQAEFPAHPMPVAQLRAVYYVFLLS